MLGTHTLQPHVWTALADVVCLFVQVEEGGKADSLEQPLRVGDEIVIINDIELTGYRQEAVALIKGSYKTLHLTVRRYTRQLLKLKPTKLRQTDRKRLFLRPTQSFLQARRVDISLSSNSLKPDNPSRRWVSVFGV